MGAEPIQGGDRTRSYPARRLHEVAPCHLISTSYLEVLGRFRAFEGVFPTLYAIAVPPGIFGRSPPWWGTRKLFLGGPGRARRDGAAARGQERARGGDSEVGGARVLSATAGGYGPFSQFHSSQFSIGLDSCKDFQGLVSMSSLVIVVH